MRRLLRMAGGSKVVEVGQWLAVSTGAFAILLVISQLIRAAARELVRRSGDSSRAKSDAELGKAGEAGPSLAVASKDAFADPAVQVHDAPPASRNSKVIPVASEYLEERADARVPAVSSDAPVPLSNELIRLAGDWIHQSNGTFAGTISGRTLTWGGPSPGNCILFWEDNMLIAEVDANCYFASVVDDTIRWTDGDVWLRVEAHARAASLAPKSSEARRPEVVAETSGLQHHQATRVQQSLAADKSEPPEIEDAPSLEPPLSSPSAPRSPARLASTSVPPAVPSAEKVQTPTSTRGVVARHASPEHAALTRLSSFTSEKAKTYSATFTAQDQALGFELRFINGCPIVTRVVEGSPAIAQGVAVQNRALAVNGVPLRGPWPIKKVSKQQWLASVFASRPLTITFEQNITLGKLCGGNPLIVRGEQAALLE